MATKSLERLIDEFNKLPGIGRKSATRLAFHILEMSEEQVEKFSEAMKEVKRLLKNVQYVEIFVKWFMQYMCRWNKR